MTPKAAQQALNRAVRSGRMERQPCEVCGATDGIHGHHDDYEKPLDVAWLCTRHHRSRHRALGWGMSGRKLGGGKSGRADNKSTLRDWLAAAHESPEAFAKRIGVNKTTVYRIINGQSTPTLPTALAIQKATKGAVKIQSLMGAA